VVPAAALTVEPIAAVRVWVMPLPAAPLPSVGANAVVELLVLAVAPLLSVPVVVLVRVAVVDSVRMQVGHFDPRPCQADQSHMTTPVRAQFHRRIRQSSRVRRS
jgi:hypothetical protein